MSDITSPVDQAATMSFLPDGDAAEYYHSLTKVVQDDWFELMRVLGQRLEKFIVFSALCFCFSCCLLSL